VCVKDAGLPIDRVSQRFTSIYLTWKRVFCVPFPYSMILDLFVLEGETLDGKEKLLHLFPPHISPV